MKIVYFVYQDKHAYERQSDGVEFCVIPSLHNEEIYFYCQEYSVFWDSIIEVGDFEKYCNFPLNIRIRPATLDEIAYKSLISHISSIKEYEVENNKTVKINYMHLPIS